MPDTQKRSVLLMAMGTTPHLLTVTLSAIYKEHPNEFPEEIHLVTTLAGLECARREIIGENGLLARFCRDYQVPVAQLSEDRIHVIGQSCGAPCQDIRTEKDSEQAADTIVALVRELTQNPATQLTVSVIGGRKSMSLLLGSAMTFYGRDADRLCHVWSVYENDASAPDYLSPQDLQANPQAIALGEIPFLRLRPILPEPLLREHFTYTQIVNASQISLTDSREVSVIEEKGRWRVLCEGQRIPAETRCIGFYIWLALRTQRGRMTQTTYTSVPIEEFFLLRWQLVNVLEKVQTERVWQNSVRRYMGLSAERIQALMRPLKDWPAKDLCGWYRALTAQLTENELHDMAVAAKQFSITVSNARTKMNEQIAEHLLKAIPDVTGRRIAAYQIGSLLQKDACEYRLALPAQKIVLPETFCSLLSEDVHEANQAWKTV